jgi:hypothetical protein
MKNAVFLDVAPCRYFINRRFRVTLLLFAYLLPACLPRRSLAMGLNLTPWLESASEIYRPTEGPPLVGEVSANFSG